MQAPQPIAELQDGAAARVEGVVRAGPSPLRSPLLDRECVYWEVRKGLSVSPDRMEATDFWIEDATGRILIRGESLEVDVRARRAKEVLETVSTDTQAVSDRLRQLKEQLRGLAGEASKPLHAERRRLARLVTFLYAVRAQARGKVHLGGMSLRDQERWIQDNAPVERDHAANTISIAVDRYEVVIAEGDRVVAEGIVGTEAVPPGMGVGGGYRERPTCRALIGPPGTGVRIMGVGASAPRRDAPSDLPVVGDFGGDGQPSPKFERAVLSVVSLIAIVAATLWWLLRS